MKLNTVNKTGRDTKADESPFAGLPFGDFLKVLKDHNFIVDVKDFADFTQAFEYYHKDLVPQNEEHTYEQICVYKSKLKYYLAPLICMNPNEQEKFYQLFDNFYITKKIADPQPVTHPLLRWIKKNRKWIITAFVVVILGMLAYFLIKKNGEKILTPPESKRFSIYHSTNAAVIEKPYSFSVKASPELNFDSTIITEWRFDDEAATLSDSIITHTFHHCGAYIVTVAVKDSATRKIINRNTLKIYVSIPVLLSVPEKKDFFINDTVTFNVVVDSFSLHFPLQWNITNKDSSRTDTVFTKGAQLNYVPKYEGNYTASLLLSDSLNCNTDLSFDFTVSRYDKFSLVLKSPVNSLSKDYHFSKYWLVALITLGLLCLYLYIILSKRKEKKQVQLPDLNIDEFKGMAAPVKIPFFSKDNKIVKLQKQSLASFLLLKRVNSDLLYLNVPGTIRRSISNLGFISPEFNNRQKDREYLVLIDDNLKNGQYVNLFTYLAKTFISDNVSLNFYFYKGKLDRIYKNQPKSALRFDQLEDKHYGANLIIFGNGYTLLSDALPQVDNSIKNKIDSWGRRIIVTPVPAIDWSANERILSKVFNMVPADMEGLINLIKFINEDLPGASSFKKDDWKTYQSKFTDLSSVKSLKAYLADEDLFQWIAAICVYHSIRWEILIEIGKMVLTESGTPGKLNYNNLLKIARIKWMEEGSFPGSLRLELLKQLTVKNELIARRTMVNLLSESDKLITKDSFSYEEKTIQKYTDSFVLYANDKTRNKAYEKDALNFMTLWDTNQIADNTLRLYLENPDYSWETPLNSPTKPGTHTNLTEFITETIKPPKSSIAAFGSLFMSFVIFCITLINFISPQSVYDTRINAYLKMVTTAYPDNFDMTVELINTDCLNLFDSSTNSRIYLVNNTGAVLDSNQLRDNKTVGGINTIVFKNVNTQALRNKMLSVQIKNSNATLISELPNVGDTLYQKFSADVLSSLCVNDTGNLQMIKIGFIYDSTDLPHNLSLFINRIIRDSFKIDTVYKQKNMANSIVYYSDPVLVGRANELASTASICFNRPVSVAYSNNTKANYLQLFLNSSTCVDIPPDSLINFVKGCWYFDDNLRYGISYQSGGLTIYDSKSDFGFISNYKSHQFFCKIQQIQQCGSKFIINCVPEKGTTGVPSRITFSYNQTNSSALRIIGSNFLPVDDYSILFDLSSYTLLQQAYAKDTGYWEGSSKDGTGTIVINGRSIIIPDTTVKSQNSEFSYISKIYKDKYNNRIYFVADNASMKPNSALVIIDRKGGKYLNSWDFDSPLSPPGAKTISIKDFRMDDFLFEEADFIKLTPSNNTKEKCDYTFKSITETNKFAASSICKLDLSGENLTSIPKELYNFINLKELNLGSTSILTFEIEQLQRRLPNCKISYEAIAMPINISGRVVVTIKEYKRSAPTTKAKPGSVIIPGDTLYYVSLIDGEIYKGSARWYIDKSGNYFPAGAVSEIGAVKQNVSDRSIGTLNVSGTYLDADTPGLKNILDVLKKEEGSINKIALIITTYNSKQENQSKKYVDKLIKKLLPYVPDSNPANIVKDWINGSKDQNSKQGDQIQGNIQNGYKVEVWIDYK